MNYIFMSDLHLSEDTPDNNKLFYSYLHGWRGQIDGLYLLGDFFDYWIGDDFINPFILEMKEQLSLFTELTPIYFIGGNHDFTVGKLFAKQTGVIILNDLSMIELGHRRVLLSHGDVFCSLDIGYQKMKKIIQNKFLISILLLLPLSVRLKIKSLLESHSDKEYDPTKQHIYQVVESDIALALYNAKATILIHGHTHHPQISMFGDNTKYTRYELAPWCGRYVGGYLAYNDGEFALFKGEI